MSGSAELEDIRLDSETDTDQGVVWRSHTHNAQNRKEGLESYNTSSCSFSRKSAK